jgi:hypothetical protein
VRTLKLGDWLGPHKVPAKFRDEPVTVIRAPNGNGLACLPGKIGFRDASLQQGAEAKALLEALEAFARPAPADRVAWELVEPLVHRHFLRAL